MVPRPERTGGVPGGVPRRNIKVTSEVLRARRMAMQQPAASGLAAPKPAAGSEEPGTPLGMDQVDLLFGDARRRAPRAGGGATTAVADSPLRRKVQAAYEYIASIYDFSTCDIGMGGETSSIKDVRGKEIISRHKQEFNSTLLFSIITCLVGGSQLFVGGPGCGKTTTAEIVAQVIFGIKLGDIQEATLYGHPNQTEEKMVAALDIVALMKGNKVVIPSAWMKARVALIDEVNRIPPELMSILYQAVDRRFAAYQGERIKMGTEAEKEEGMPQGPLFATMNKADAGNYPVPAPAMDRFDICVQSSGMNPMNAEMKLFLDRHMKISDQHKLSDKELKDIWHEIQEMPIADTTMFRFKYLMAVLRSCIIAGNYPYNRLKANLESESQRQCQSGCALAKKMCGWIRETGLSVRGMEAFYDYARALAWVAGRGEVDEEIARIAWRYVINHRFSPSESALNGVENLPATLNSKAFVHDHISFADFMWDRAGMEITKDGVLTEIQDFLLKTLNDETVGRQKQIEQINALIKKVGEINSAGRYDIVEYLDGLVKELEKEEA